MKSQQNKIELVARPDHSLAFTKRGKVVLTAHRLQLTEIIKACSLSQIIDHKTGHWVLQHGLQTEFAPETGVDTIHPYIYRFTVARICVQHSFSTTIATNGGAVQLRGNFANRWVVF